MKDSVQSLSKDKRGFWFYLKRDRLLYLLLLPGVLYFIIFKYLPMVGIVIAFENFKPYWGIKGLFTSEFVGLHWFRRFFNSAYSGRLIWNTFFISFLKLVFGFPAPIILALLLNEIRNRHFKKIVQSISYVPYFLSWVVVAGLVQQMTSTDGGIINVIVSFFGGEKVYFLGSTKYFRSIMVISAIWRNVGWDSIVYLAAIAGIDQEMYDAAKVDGAGFFRRMWNVTIPSIMPIISIMLILRTGRLLDAGFEQTLMLLTPSVYSVGDIIDTFVYREGIMHMNYSYTMAVSLFKSVIAFVMVLTTNNIAKRLGQEGIW
jgi:putative aldouronate transport system permease protein